MVEEENSHMNKDDEEKDMVKVQIETSEGKNTHLSLPMVLQCVYINCKK